MLVCSSCVFVCVCCVSLHAFSSVCCLFVVGMLLSCLLVFFVVCLVFRCRVPTSVGSKTTVCDSVCFVLDLTRSASTSASAALASASSLWQRKTSLHLLQGVDYGSRRQGDGHLEESVRFGSDTLRVDFGFKSPATG